MSPLDFFRRPPSPHKYARLLRTKLARHAPGQVIHYDEAGFRLLLGDAGEGGVINLHTLYHEYCAVAPQERGRQLDRCVALAFPPVVPASFADARARLMPALRSRGMAECLRLANLANHTDAPPGSLFLPFSSDAMLVLVLDGEDTIQTFGPEQLEQWGISADEALAIAMDNLRDATNDQFTQPLPGVFAGAWDDDYDSSRLLLPDLAHRIAGSNPVAMVPARGRLLLASGNDQDAVRAMVDYARQIADTETRPVSALLYRYENGTAVEHVPADGGARTELARLRQQYCHENYAAQGEALDELHEQDETDIFVAGYKVMRERASGVEYSYCVWTEGVDTLLPRTDLVALAYYGNGGQEAEQFMLPWDALQAACGHLLAPMPDAFLERYRVTGYPDLELARNLALR